MTGEDGYGGTVERTENLMAWMKECWEQSIGTKAHENDVKKCFSDFSTLISASSGLCSARVYTLLQDLHPYLHFVDSPPTSRASYCLQEYSSSTLQGLNQLPKSISNFTSSYYSTKNEQATDFD